MPHLFSLMRSLLAWLSRPSLPIRLLQEETVRCYAEIHRLNDLLTQAYERAGVIPRQHQGPPPVQPEQRKTMGEMQVDFQNERIAEYKAWQAEEAERLSHVHQKPS